MNDRQRLILKLFQEGRDPREIAREAKVTLSYVKQVTKKAAKAAAAPRAEDGCETRTRLEAAMMRWIEITEASQKKILELANLGKPAQAMAIQAGIASQRAAELLDRLDVGRGLPEDLPDDDDDARKIIRRAWWTAARNGSSNAMVKLAASYGIRAQRTQAVKVEFERPGGENDQAPEAPSASGGDPLEP